MLTITLELRVDFKDEEKRKMLVDLCREKARELYTLAAMLKENREPRIMISSGDMFETNKDLDLMSEADLASL